MAKTPAPKPSGTVALSGVAAPDPQNANRGTARGRVLVEQSIRNYGAARSIVVDRQGKIIAGHKTYDAAKAAGLEHAVVVHSDGEALIVVQRDDLDLDRDVKARELAIVDNRAGEVGLEWSPEMLRAVQAGGASLEATGFTSAELAAIFGESAPGRTEPDAVPEPRRTTIRVGDLFRLGRHRLICGDATNPAIVARLMGATRAGLMNTDPPYGVSYGNEERPNPGVAKPRVAKPRVANDTLADAKLQAFLELAFRAAKEKALTENAAWYLWHAHLTQGFFAAAAAAAAAAAVILHRQIIWVKPVLLLGRGQYHWKHEPCFFGWVEGHRPPDYGLGHGERTQTTVWEVASVTHAERKTFNHSTPKPVGLFTIPITKHLRDGEACYDPFAGTGPQFIAAEQSGAACHGIEIEPVCCQVIIDRWEAFTGQKAERLDRPAAPASLDRRRARRSSPPASARRPRPKT